MCLAGATSSISRFVGARNHEEANQAAIHSFVILNIAFVLLVIILLVLQDMNQEFGKII